MKSDGVSQIPTSQIRREADRYWKDNQYNEVEHRGVGTGVLGLDSFPINGTTAPRLFAEQVKIERLAKAGYGLSPYRIQYWMEERDPLMKIAARNGFPKRIRHWLWGQAYQELSMKQDFGHMQIGELVINTDPTHAYLLDELAFYEQRLIMAHVTGHSDFFKNNVNFRDTDRNMLNHMADHFHAVEDMLDRGVMTPDELEKFLDKVKTFENCIDMGAFKPRPLDMSARHIKDPPPIPNDFGKVSTEHLHPDVLRLLNAPERVAEARDQEKQRLREEMVKVPKHPDPDLLGFLIEHSTVLTPWQRDVLAMVRDESYYFSPQRKTKIMNEGWATYWHGQLLKDPELRDPEHRIGLTHHQGQLTHMSSVTANPYTIGLEIFKNIKKRWDKGQFGPEYEESRERNKEETWDTHAIQGEQKIFEVRKMYGDISFINSFLTPESVRELKIYTWSAGQNPEPGAPIVISSREVDDIRKNLSAAISNGGTPFIQVLNGDFGSKGELLVEHVHEYDLRPDWADEVLKNIKAIWGRPVNLFTYVSENDAHGNVLQSTKKRMWIKVFDGEHGGIAKNDHIARRIISEDGKVLYDCDSKGEKIR